MFLVANRSALVRPCFDVMLTGGRLWHQCPLVTDFAKAGTGLVEFSPFILTPQENAWDTASVK